MVLVVVAGVMAGAAVGPHPGWVLATTIAVTVLAAALLRGAHRPAGSHGPAGFHGPAGSRSSPPSSRSPAQGVLALAVLGLAGAGVAGARAAAVHHGVLIGMAARGGTVMVDATVAEEPNTVRYGGRWVVLSVRRVEVAGQAWRTRERVGVILPGTAGTIAVGDRLRVAAGVERSNRTDPLGGEPVTVLRRPRVVSRSPSRSWLLRVSEAVRAAARQRALDSLPPERAGLLVGIALSVLFALLTRWEPSVLRASAMAVLALLGVATGRGPGGRRALCLAVTLLLLANPALVSSLGFRLSVAATAGVLWLGPTATRVLPGRLPHVVRSAIGISLGAQAGATPVLALAFGQVSMAGLAANLVAVPLATAPMLLGVVAAAASVLGPLAAVAILACRLADPFLAALVAIAEHTSTLPTASLSLSGPTRLVPTAAVIACTVLARRRAAALIREREAEGHRRRRFRTTQPRANEGVEGPGSGSEARTAPGDIPRPPGTPRRLGL